MWFIFFYFTFGRLKNVISTNLDKTYELLGMPSDVHDNLVTSIVNMTKQKLRKNNSKNQEIEGT